MLIVLAPRALPLTRVWCRADARALQSTPPCSRKRRSSAWIQAWIKPGEISARVSQSSRRDFSSTRISCSSLPSRSSSLALEDRYRPLTSAKDKMASATAEVGQRLGEIVRAESSLASARPYRERASTADTILTLRSAVERGERRITLPSMKPRRPATILLRLSLGISQSTSCPRARR